MYGVFSYFMGKTIMDLPVLIIAPMCSTLIIYFGFGLQNTVS